MRIKILAKAAMLNIIAKVTPMWIMFELMSESVNSSREIKSFTRGSRVCMSESLLLNMNALATQYITNTSLTREPALSCKDGVKDLFII